MLTAALKGWVRRIAEPLALGLGAIGLTPNILTIIGFVLNIAVAIVLFSGQLNAGGILILVVSAFDTLDGALARATEQVTKFGAFLDSTLDRYSEGVIFIGLLAHFSAQGDQLASLLSAASLIGSLMVSYTRARAEGLGIACEVGLLARPERIIILGIGLMVGQAIIALAILAVFSNVTAVQRVAHVWQSTKGR